MLDAARLQPAALESLARQGIPVPRYPRGQAPGVVHLGLGAFHRAHQALVFDDLLAGGDARWGVLGVATRSVGLADILSAQQGLYAINLADAAGDAWRVVGALLQTLSVQRDLDQVHAAIAQPTTRWITATVTEKGYDASLGQLIAQGLRLRRDAGLGGLTLASCDNLSHNGDKLQALCLEHAEDAALAAWISATCRFPSSMVDRIVPAATADCAAQALQVLGVADGAALFSEPFWQWVIEDHFVDPSDGAALASAGVMVVNDVSPFEAAKLRLLNGSHSAMACIGAVMGLHTVYDCMASADLRAFIAQLMAQEASIGLERPGVPAYCEALLQRFANPRMAHGVHQITSDSSQKIGLRWVPAILAQLQGNGPLQHYALAAAVWMRYFSGCDDQGQSYTIKDPQAEPLQRLAQAHAGDAQGMVQAFLQVTSIWGTELATRARWQQAVVQQLQTVLTTDSASALRQLVTTHRDH